MCQILCEAMLSNSALHNDENIRYLHFLHIVVICHIVANEAEKLNFFIEFYFNSFKLNLNGCMWLPVIELGRTGMRNRYYEVSQFSQCGCGDWARCKCSIVFSDNCPQGYQSFRIITCKHTNLQWRWLSLYPEVQYMLYIVKCPCTCTCIYSEKAKCYVSFKLRSVRGW